MAIFKLLKAFIIFLLLIAGICQADDQYEIVPASHRNGTRAHLWLSDGPTDVVSSNQSIGNRFRLGAELQFGPDYRWIFGLTVLDILSSGETSNIVGDISRVGWDFDFGYFFIPDRLWLEYSFQLGTVHGSNIGGHVGTIGNALDLGYRFYNQNGINLAVNAGYIHIQSETVGTFDFVNQVSGSATYPSANVYTLALVFGFDTGEYR